MGLRVHAKPATCGVIGVVERRPALGTPCRALAQAAVLAFALLTAFRAPEEWTTSGKGEVFDLVQCSQRIYMGEAANTSQAPLLWLTGRRDGHSGFSR